MQLRGQERRAQDEVYSVDGKKDGHTIDTVKMQELWKDKDGPNFLFPSFSLLQFSGVQ